jgi:WD40 repeat protein
MFIQSTCSQNRSDPFYVSHTGSENPKDTPQCMMFSEADQNLFAAGSWDQTVRLYEIDPLFGNLNQRAVMSVPHYPLALDFMPDNAGLLVSCGDRSLYLIDLPKLSIHKIQSSNCQTLFLRVINKHNLILSVDEVNTLSINSASSPYKCQFSVQFEYQTKAIDISGEIILIGFDNSKFAIIDLKSIGICQPRDFIYNECWLKSPISAVAIDSEGKRFAIGTCDGMIHVGNFSQIPSGFSVISSENKKIYSADSKMNEEEIFTFLAHAQSENDNLNDVYNVSGVGFNKRSNHFLFSIGSEGVLNIWDIKTKDIILTRGFENPIACGCINSSGTVLAFGLGYDWNQGVWGFPKVTTSPKIGFFPINDNDLICNKASKILMKKSNHNKSELSQSTKPLFNR